MRAGHRCLLEEYDSGNRSRWLWWQTLAVLATVAVRDVRDHKWLAARAVYALSRRLDGGTLHRRYRPAMLGALAAYAVFAKTWVYVSQIQHYWSLPADAMRVLMDIALTAVVICLIFVGGLLPARRSTDALLDNLESM